MLSLKGSSPCGELCDFVDEPSLNAKRSSCAVTKFLHAMIRVTDPEATLAFFALIFLAAPGEENIAEVELTYNWPAEDGTPAEVYTGGRNFGHLAYRVSNIYETCAKIMAAGHIIHRPPRDGHMAFVKSPDGISIELLQDGHLEPAEPWASMENIGSW